MSSTIQFRLDNLTPQQCWALRQLRDLFADPAQRVAMANWLDGETALRLDPDTGLLVQIDNARIPLGLEEALPATFAEQFVEFVQARATPERTAANGYLLPGEMIKDWMTGEAVGICAGSDGSDGSDEYNQRKETTP